MDIFTVTLIALPVLIFISAFFSGSEMALFSIKLSEMHEFSLSTRKREQSIIRLMEYPEKILITVLTGKLLVNVVFSALATVILLKVWGEFGHFISIVVVTPIIILLCEIAPKVFPIHAYRKFAQKGIPLLNLFHLVFAPVRVVFLALINILIKLLRLKPMDEKAITHEELGKSVTTSAGEEDIQKHENEFIKNVLLFSQKEASNIMYPRTKAIFIPYNTSIDDALGIMLEHKIIRAPVYKEDFDNVIGVLDSRELISSVRSKKKLKTINKLIHDIAHFPASKELGDLLKDFLSKKIQLAVLVDEYGGTAGIVTLSAILSELMGKKFIKGESPRKQEIRTMGDGTAIISGDMQIEDFNFLFNAHIQTNESDTVAGFIIERLGHFPKRRESIAVEQHLLRVKYIRKNRIESIEIIPSRGNENDSRNE